MKKYAWLAVMLLALSLVFFGCDYGTGDGAAGDIPTKQYEVTFAGLAGATPDVIKELIIVSGSSIGANDFPADPTKSGSTFDGWWDLATTTQITATTAITKHTTLTAKWVTNYATDKVYEVPLKGVTVKNSTAFTAAGDSVTVTLPSYPAAFDIDKYMSFNAVVKAYDEDGKGIDLAANLEAVVTATNPRWDNIGKEGLIEFRNPIDDSLIDADNDEEMATAPTAITLISRDAKVKYLALESITFNPAVVPDFTVSIGGKAEVVDFKALNGTIDLLLDGRNGFRWTNLGGGAGNQYAAAYFPVTFRKGFKFADYKSITFNFKAIAGMVTWKAICVGATATDPLSAPVTKFGDTTTGTGHPVDDQGLRTFNIPSTNAGVLALDAVVGPLNVFIYVDGGDKGEEQSWWGPNSNGVVNTSFEIWDIAFNE
jgi:uncharacterized repeat protein (TIGR02543 family)